MCHVTRKNAKRQKCECQCILGIRAAGQKYREEREMAGRRGVILFFPVFLSRRAAKRRQMASVYYALC